MGNDQYYSNATQENKHDALILVPLAILNFLCVHPFSDGNGRMSRLLTLMLLYQFNYQVGRYISLERIFEDSKENYYEKLEASSHHWHAVNPVISTAIKLLILTGARRTEVAAMRWDELALDSGAWVLPTNRTKNRQPHTIYLPQIAINLIMDLKKLTGQSELSE